MHGVVVTVDIEGEIEDVLKMLDEFTIPRAKSLEGFVRGVWIRSSDGSQGQSIVLFDSEEHAQAAAEVIRQGPPPGAPISLRSAEVFEVVREA